MSATLEILEPTILVLQGRTATAWTETGLVQTRRFTTNLSEAQFNGKRVLMCEFSHPSAREPQRWGANLDSPYLNEVVSPTLKSAVRRLRPE